MIPEQNFNTETQSHRVTENLNLWFSSLYLCASVPLC